MSRDDSMGFFNSAPPVRRNELLIASRHYPTRCDADSNFARRLYTKCAKRLKSNAVLRFALQPETGSHCCCLPCFEATGGSIQKRAPRMVPGRNVDPIP
jgi:hypothetical protein